MQIQSNEAEQKDNTKTQEHQKLVIQKEKEIYKLYGV